MGRNPAHHILRDTHKNPTRTNRRKKPQRYAEDETITSRTNEDEVDEEEKEKEEHEREKTRRKEESRRGNKKEEEADPTTSPQHKRVVSSRGDAMVFMYRSKPVRLELDIQHGVK